MFGDLPPADWSGLDMSDRYYTQKLWARAPLQSGAKNMKKQTNMSTLKQINVVTFHGNIFQTTTKQSGIPPMKKNKKQLEDAFEDECKMLAANEVAEAGWWDG